MILQSGSRCVAIHPLGSETYFRACHSPVLYAIWAPRLPNGAARRDISGQRFRWMSAKISSIDSSRVRRKHLEQCVTQHVRCFSAPKRSYTTRDDSQPVPKTTNTPPPRSSRRRIVLLGLVASALSITIVNTSLFHGANDENLSPVRFNGFTLDYIQPITDVTSIFSLSRPPFKQADADRFAEISKAGIWSIEIKQPDMQIARYYTPLPPCSKLSEGMETFLRENKLGIQLLVKREVKGEVSGWLFRQSGNHAIEIRGPYLEYALPDDVSEVIFLAGGTGIAPVLQVAYALQQRSIQPAIERVTAPKTHVQIAWANRHHHDSSRLEDRRVFNTTQLTQSDVAGGLLTERLAAFRGHPSASLQVTAEMYQDDKGQSLNLDALRALVAQADQRHSQNRSKGKKLIFVSGSDGFINYLAGKQTPGSAQTVKDGLLSHLRLENWTVVRLGGDSLH